MNSNSALIVLDGVEISTADLNALDPEVIEGFSILKDAPLQHCTEPAEPTVS